MMNKLVVEVVDAIGLKPVDGEGSASPFVEVVFDDQQQRTETKHKDLNPYWNHKLVFNINNPTHLPHKTIQVAVHNNRKLGHRKTCLGRVIISGHVVPLSESEAAVRRYPLEQRGLFSDPKGEIDLRFYAFYDPSATNTNTAPPQPQPHPYYDDETPLQEINTNMLDDQESMVGDFEKKKKNKKTEKEFRTFHSIGAEKTVNNSIEGKTSTMNQSLFGIQASSRK